MVSGQTTTVVMAMCLVAHHVRHTVHATDTEALHLVSGFSGCVGSGLASGSNFGEELGHGAAEHIGAFRGRIRGRRGDLVDGSDMKLSGVILNLKLIAYLRVTYLAFGRLDDLEIEIIDGDHLVVKTQES